MEVYPLAQETGKLLFQGQELQARYLAGLELHQKVQVAFRIRFSPGKGAKNPKAPYTVAAAHLGKGLEGGA